MKITCSLSDSLYGRILYNSDVGDVGNLYAKRSFPLSIGISLCKSAVRPPRNTQGS